MEYDGLTTYQIAMLKNKGELDERQANIYIENLKREVEKRDGVMERKTNRFALKEVKDDGIKIPFFSWFSEKFSGEELVTPDPWKNSSKLKYMRFGEKPISPAKSYKMRLATWAGALVTSAVIILSPNLDYISKSFQEIGNYFTRSVQTEVYKPNVFPEPPRTSLTSPSEALATIEKPMIKEEENKYVVKKGDTLWGICTKRGCDYKQIAKANDIKITLKDGKDYALIRPGDKINLGETSIQTPFKPLEEKVIPHKIKTNPHSLDKVVDDYIMQLSRRMS